MAINIKTQNETKILLKTALLEGLDISMFKDNILSGKPPTEEFNSWFYERIELQRVFIEFINNPTTKRKQMLNKYVAICGYSDVWIESILTKLNICIIIDPEILHETEIKTFSEQVSIPKPIPNKFCNKCGARIEDGCEACTKCRDVPKKEKLETEKKKKSKFCRACGNPIEKESKECTKCGTRLDTKQCRNQNCKKIISEVSVFCPYCSSLN